MLEDIEGLTVEQLQQSLPITIGADPRFSKSLKPLLRQLEMWINFQALKADWYGDDNFILSFDFTLVRSLEEKQLTADSWVVETGYAYHYESSNLTTIAFIAIDDLVRDGAGIEQEIKARLTAVANTIAVQHGLLALE
ncbi:hypothetical protein FM038_019855 [Shewanella eurypsychrophilus]|uniref:Uncharacterized protein n=1 Tax=Shewanella eurypsychrophilus TaxID=2593656 RepID=A0ABX6V9M6_9GAMM|nr:MULTISPECIES: hypothetical protein [Shewanella]QFU24182.1 hypothetical protein FS418_21580 [Shewanella sp. YLB-09]QPG59388.1 hypothetical protein FM038_019855 [Shewanella eurypsychrophilus]